MDVEDLFNEEDNTDGDVDMFLDAILDDGNNNTKTEEDTMSHEVSRDNDNKQKEEVGLIAKMQAMEAELIQLRNRLHTTESKVIPTPSFKKGKRVAHDNGMSSESLAPLPKRRALIEESKVFITDKYSGLRINNPSISSELMNVRMKGRRLVKIPQIGGVVKDGEVEGDWVTIGVIVSKSLPRDTCKGKKFSIWRLSDLSSQFANISFFLFDKVFQSHWKIPVGHVIAILNANILTNKDTNSATGVSCNNNKYSLSLDNPAKLMDMGVSYDFTICKAMTKSGKPCQNYTNKQNGGYCDYHVSKEYGKMRSNRMNCQGGYGPNAQSLQKKLLGQSDVMYGGRLFSGQGQGGGTAGKRKSNGVMFVPGVKKELKEVELLLGITTDSKPEKRIGGDDILKQLMKGQTPGALCLNQHIKTKKSESPSALLEKEKSALALLQEHSQRKSQTSVTQSKTSVTQSQTSVTQSKTSVTQSKTSVTQSQTSVTQSKTSVTQSQTSVTQSKTSVAKSQTSVAKSQTSVAKSQTSVTQSHASVTKSQTSVTKSQANVSVGRSSKKPILSSSEDFELFRPDNLVITEIPRGVDTAPLPTNTSAVSPKKQSISPPTIKKPLTTVRSHSLILSKQPSLHSNERKKEKALAILREKGPLRKINPNNILTGKILNDRKQSEIKKRLEGDHDREESKENHLVLADSEFEKILNAKSSHNWTVMEDDNEKQETYFNNLEKKEQLQERLSQITELNVRVVQCRKCNYISESVGGICRKENHSINKLRAMKRCFKCGGCGQRMFTYNERYPTRSCQCGESSKFHKCSLYKEKAGPKLPSEVLLLRGDEQKFLNSLN